MDKLLDADKYALGRAKAQRNSACTEYRFAHIGVRTTRLACADIAALPASTSADMADILGIAQPSQLRVFAIHRTHAPNIHRAKLLLPPASHYATSSVNKNKND
jgi:hypothetical protein